jgi:AcrR family transcriptional regulator
MSTRDRILDAAAEVMTRRGIAATTTRAIAAAAGCSEALLYKHFDDKQQIFLAVLLERMPTISGRDDQAPAATVAESLAELVHRMFDLFLRSFPMAVSIFGTPELLAEHRDSVRSHGYGPEGAIGLATAQLERDRERGLISASADLTAAASVLVGFAFHQAFLAAFDGRDAPQADAVAGAVSAVLPYLDAGDGDE